jgi:hypothetical protein
LLFAKMHHDDTAAGGTLITDPRATPATVVPSAPTSPSVHALHSRFISKRRLELWGSAQAPDGTTVRIGIEQAGTTVRPLTTAPVSRGHFYATAQVPEPLGTKHLTLEAVLTR